MHLSMVAPVPLAHLSAAKYAPWWPPEKACRALPVRRLLGS
jgi:hypothetical protein